MARQRKSIHKVDTNLPTPASEDVSQLRMALDRFQAIDNRLLRWILRLLPWVMLIFAFYDVNLWIDDAGGVMWNTGFAMGAFALLAMQGMIRRIPDTLRALWDRHIIQIQSAITNNGNGQVTRPISLANEYKNFVESSQRTFNSPYQNVVGILGVCLAIVWLYFQGANRSPDFFFRLLIEGIPGYLAGILAWRMIIVGVQIWKLSKQFDISPQLGHPDQCGGLGVIGNLCFWNALISSLGGIYLGGWIIVGTSLPHFETLGASSELYFSFVDLAQWFTPLFSQLLLVPVILSVITFFWPVWRIHQIMVTKKNDIQRRLDQLSESIDRLSTELLLNTETLDPAESEKVAKKLDRIRQVYDENKSIPVWPFNTKIILKFTASQLVPILSLTGLGTEIVKLIASLLTAMISA